MVILTVGIFVYIVSDYLYFALNYPECKSCGWLTKEAGKCCGCGSIRRYRWQ